MGGLLIGMDEGGMWRIVLLVVVVGSTEDVSSPEEAKVS